MRPINSEPEKKYKRVYIIVETVEYEGSEIPSIAFETEEQAREYLKSTQSRSFTSRDYYPLDVELKN